MSVKREGGGSVSVGAKGLVDEGGCRCYVKSESVLTCNYICQINAVGQNV